MSFTIASVHANSQRPHPAMRGRRQSFCELPVSRCDAPRRNRTANRDAKLSFPRRASGETPTLLLAIRFRAAVEPSILLPMSRRQPLSRGQLSCPITLMRMPPSDRAKRTRESGIQASHCSGRSRLDIRLHPAGSRQRRPLAAAPYHELSGNVCCCARRLRHRTLAAVQASVRRQAFAATCSR